MALILLIALAAGCAPTAAREGVRWAVDPDHQFPTTTRMFLYGPAADVDAIVEAGRPLGWRSVAHSVTASGSALALLEGPSSALADPFLERLDGNPNLTFGPAFTPTERRPIQRR